MKTIKKIAILCIIMFQLLSCINEKPESIQSQLDDYKHADIEVKTINKLLENIRPSLQAWSSKLKEFEFITFEVVKNMNTDEITLANFKATEIFPISTVDAYYKSARSTYIVSCDNEGDGDDWEEECSGIASCGALVKKCFEEGGCAQICENKSTSEVQYASVELIFLPVKNY